MNRLVISAVCLAFSGCTTTLSVVEPAPKCNVPQAMLDRCNQPIPIEEGTTFGRIIEIAGEDRDNLRACALRQERLAGAVATCNAEIDKYNQGISELNARNAARK